MSTPFSVNVNTISGLNQSSSSAPATVSASVNSDGTSVDPSTSVANSTASDNPVTAKSKDLTSDDFLKLLMTELQYQDPLSPMDNQAMMTQMAQMESIQSSNSMQKSINDMSASFKGSVSAQQSSAQSMVNATSVSLIGKKVTVKQDNVDWSGAAGQTEDIRVHLGNNDSAQVEILDDKGNILKTLQTSGKDAQNSSTVTWDGTTDAGSYAPAGTYAITIAGQDKDPSLYAFVEDTVQGVQFSSNGAKLEVGGKELTVANVMDVAPDDQTSNFGSISPSAAIELLGKKVRVSQPTITFGGKNMETVQIKVNASKSSLVGINIADAQGVIVARLKGTADATGTATFLWNGETNTGAYADPGTYSVKIDGSATNPSLYSFSEGIVDGIGASSDGVTQLRMNGQTVSLSRIIDISSQS
jgi:flagellar basal-body rod modification protein FlgD